ncbi:Kinesin domain-containing protein/DUF3490 domain-containing protein [Cephalotus follicularis]|uniref:Kinesin-like protein n=1 Tax=Cephalotus follicularis TaxID=3775 RepID=A0A1Q3BZH2_CEPFO|nr:Kinesin domain-containing protein/DUF3490 domain-containing protein [Cephalotus follicularis]
MGAIGGEELINMEKMQMAMAREEKILVLVRLRPLSEKETAANEVADWECINDTTILYRNTLREGSTFPSAYTFDRVFRGDCLTKQVYVEGAKEIALSVVSGINSSIFAYGQTSSGKTYTMIGITEYTAADIFDYIHMHEERAFVLKFSAIEIYNEAVRDLLSTDNAPLRLLDDPEKGTIVDKVTEEILKDWNHLNDLLSVCEAQRRNGETSLNEKSSRSHQIIRLTIESSAREFLGKGNSTTLSASVNFVDLAGSERASQALSAGARLKEGCHINRSLLTLSTVIRKLSKGRHGHINYRDSKLTRMLQPCLGGNARTAIICTLSPARSHVEQTRNTLLFACCAKEVTTKAQVNVVMSDKALVKHLQKELARLESELRSPAQASSTGDYAALLRKKDLQIQKMEKEIRELTKQRDLAQSRVADLLDVIKHDQNSQQSTGTGHYSNQQAALEDEFSASESSGLFDSHQLDVADRRPRYYETESGSNAEEPYHQLQGNYEDDYLSDGTSSPPTIGKKFVRSNSGQNLERTADDPDEYCKEVQCIEMNESSRDKNLESRALSNDENEGILALTVHGDDLNGDATAQEITSTPGLGDRGVSHISNGFTYSALDLRLDHEREALDSLVSPYPDILSSRAREAELSSSSSMKLTRSWSCRANLVNGSSSPCFEKEEQIESTPHNRLEKNCTGRPHSVRRKFPPLNYGDNTLSLSRNGSMSSPGSASTDDLTNSIRTSAGEYITGIDTFVAGLKEAKHQFENQLVDGQEVDLKSGKFERNAKETPPDWPLEFGRQQRAIIELWQTCNVSLVHRTYFFLLFKGDPTDSIYMEVEIRRLSFLKETFSQGNQGVEDGQTLTLASSMRALNGEREMLSKLMGKRFSKDERNKLYQKLGIALNSKRRRLQLANHLWSNTEDMIHIKESASIVAKLIRFVEQGHALKEMFGLSFTPPRTRRRSYRWKNSMASLL